MPADMRDCIRRRTGRSDGRQPQRAHSADPLNPCAPSIDFFTVAPEPPAPAILPSLLSPDDESLPDGESASLPLSDVFAELLDPRDGAAEIAARLVQRAL
jgi:hypothetical protein